jgi:DNA-binding MarR family transcriptional regulator
MNGTNDLIVAIVRARDRLLRAAEETIREVGLSEPQFNVLRILRGAGEALPTSELGRRMITRVPDITRLVDRLEKLGLVTRRRDPEGDRRQVLVEITPAGKEKIRPLDGVLDARMNALFQKIGGSDRKIIVDLLKRIGHE